MGFATSVSTAIILVGALLVFSFSYPTISTSYEKVREANQEEHVRMMKQLKTSIEVQDKNGNTVYVLQPPKTYYLYNSGEYTIDLDKVIVLDDGVYTTTRIFDASTHYLYPGGRVKLHLGGLEGNIKIITDCGASVTVEVT